MGQVHEPNCMGQNRVLVSVLTLRRSRLPSFIVMRSWDFVIGE